MNNSISTTLSNRTVHSSFLTNQKLNISTGVRNAQTSSFRNSNSEESDFRARAETNPNDESNNKLKRGSLRKTNKFATSIMKAGSNLLLPGMNNLI